MFWAKKGNEEESSSLLPAAQQLKNLKWRRQLTRDFSHLDIWEKSTENSLVWTPPLHYWQPQARWVALASNHKVILIPNTIFGINYQTLLSLSMHVRSGQGMRKDEFKKKFKKWEINFWEKAKEEAEEDIWEGEIVYGNRKKGADVLQWEKTWLGNIWKENKW